MSLDYIFVASSRPVADVSSIESFEEDQSKDEEFYSNLAETIFPDFNFSNGIGSLKAKNISCELNPSDSSLSVSFRGADDFLFFIDKAQGIAQEIQVVVIDLQTSELFEGQAPEVKQYKSWYNRILSRS